MINEVYQMCLALLNKNNYGYMTPQEFNLFAYQAQLDIFEDLFMDYNLQITKRASRRSDTGYPDIAKGIEETLAIFSNTVALTNQSNQPLNANWTVNANSAAVNNLYSLPYDYYLINKLFYLPTMTYNIDGSLGTTLPADFPNKGNYYAGAFGWGPTLPTPVVGDYVVNLLTTNAADAGVTEYPVSQIMSIEQTPLTGFYSTTQFIWKVGADFPSFKIFSKKGLIEIEKVSQKRIFNLSTSNLTAPSTQWPAYVLRGNKDTGNQTAEIYPMEIINETGMVFCQYIRYPKTPNWTYSGSTGGRPIFNQSQPDYQDFELPQDSFQDLVARILQYGGLTIREVSAIQYGQALEGAEASEHKGK